MTQKVDIKTEQEIEALKEGGKILASIIDSLAKAVKPGISTLALEKLARKLMDEHGVVPSFLGFGQPPYPAATCISVNDGIVHGIPNKNILRRGDIVGIDVGVWYKNLCTDMAATVPVGEVSADVRRLLKGTRESLTAGIEKIKAGIKTGDIGHAIEQIAAKYNLSVVDGLTGHGVGRGVHEYPPLANYGRKDTGVVLPIGAVVAIEPMFSLGAPDIKVAANDWDILTVDGSWSAHYEQTVAITKDGFEILTPYVNEQYWS